MNHIQHTGRFTLQQPMDAVFPLFSPEGEKLWVPGWSYENIMGHQRLHEDYIFLTRHHDHGSTDAIWLVKRYEPERGHVAFYKIEPGDKVGTITVKCTALTQESVQVEVTYAYTALSDTGRDFIKNFDEGAYRKYMKEWQTLLQKWFSRKK